MEFREDVFATTNTKLAATLMVFGLKLCRHMPLEANIIYASKQDYLENRINPKYGKPVPQVSFNFDMRDKSELIGKVDKAYGDDEAEEKFQESLASLAPQQQEIIAAAHSVAVASACHECLDAREYLVQLVHHVSDDFKWDVIRGNGAGELVRIGRNSSDALREEFLSKI